MAALVIGPPHALTGAIARRLRGPGESVLQAVPADAAGAERAGWLLEEAGDPGLVIVVESAPYATLHELIGRTGARIVLVAEHRAAAAGAAPGRAWAPRDGEGLAVVALGRAGRRWFPLAGPRRDAMGAERAAALVLRACGAAAASSR
jgi:hypothetical protein